MNPESFETENEQLLEQTHDPDDEKVEPPPEKRNTKKTIIAKIKDLCSQHELELNQSDTQLNRSAKATLQKLLAQKAEEAVTKKMMNSHRETVIQQTGEAREYLALQTLRYGLDTLNRIIDRTANMVLPTVNYELEGFTECFNDPRTEAEVKDILLTILRENPDIASHISNPYLRLGFVYVGAVSMSIKKIDKTQKYATIRSAGNEKVSTSRVHDTRSPKTG